MNKKVKITILIIIAGLIFYKLFLVRGATLLFCKRLTGTKTRNIYRAFEKGGGGTNDIEDSYIVTEKNRLYKQCLAGDEDL